MVSGIEFGRHSIGIVTRPYETYRRIVERGKLGELGYLGALLCSYFALASVVKTAAFRPFLLTREFAVLVCASVATYLFMAGLLWAIGQRLGGKGTLRGFLLGWAYTLYPTLLWFLATSLLYVFLPPPRTTQPMGVAFSLVYLVFSATLFFWKITLAYLALRFGMKLTLFKILIVSVIAAPCIGAYSIGMYKLGIFRIPFI